MPNAIPTQPTQPALRAMALAALCLSLGANVPVWAQAAPAAGHALPLSGE
ncbi:hypothetical protein G3N97_38195, partial [Paraburkholderia sp. Ac-20347]|nr:hypothetical protein [Paraburkholderia sp. Ac-20347]